MNQFQDRGRVRQHAAMTGSRRQAAGIVGPGAVAAIGVGWYAAAGWALVFAGRGVYWALGGTVGLDPFARHPTGSPSRERALLAARDIAILKAVGMSPRQLLAIWVSTASAVLGVIGGLFALPLGVRTYHGLMTQLARQVGTALRRSRSRSSSRRRSTRWA